MSKAVFGLLAVLVVSAAVGAQLFYKASCQKAETKVVDDEHQDDKETEKETETVDEKASEPKAFLKEKFESTDTIKANPAVDLSVQEHNIPQDEKSDVTSTSLKTESVESKDNEEIEDLVLLLEEQEEIVKNTKALHPGKSISPLPYLDETVIRCLSQEDLRQLDQALLAAKNHKEITRKDQIEAELFSVSGSRKKKRNA